MNTTPVVLGRCTQSNRVETLGWRHGIFLGSNMVRGFELKIFARNRSQSVSRLSECFRNRLNTQERSFWIKEEKTLVRGVYRQEKRKNKTRVPGDLKMVKLKSTKQIVIVCHRYERLAVLKVLHEYFALSKWSTLENMHLGETVHK